MVDNSKPEPEGLTGVYMPMSKSFEATPLYKQIVKRLPAVNIVQLRPQSPGTTILRWIVHALKAAFNSGVTLREGGIDGDFDARIASAFEPFTKTKPSAKEPFFIPSDLTGDEKLPLSISSFFMLFASSTFKKYNFKIMSSPNITIKTDAGWQKADKSVLQMISRSISGVIKKVSGGQGGPNIGEILGTALDYLGYDIQLGPHFKVTDIMKNYPTFSFTTNLINDSAESARQNKEILRHLTRDSLPTAGMYKTNAELEGADVLSKLEHNMAFQPGGLFNVNVGVSIGGDQEGKLTPLKQLFLCTANITVTAKGIYRDGKTPEVYEVKFDFTSLLPDYYNLQLQNFQERAEGTALLGLPPARGFDTNDGQRYGPINPDYKPGIKWQSNEFTKLPGHYSVDGYWHPVNVMENPTGIMLDKNGYPMTYWQQQAYVKDVMADLQKKLNNQAPMSDEDLALWGDIYPTLDKP